MKGLTAENIEFEVWPCGTEVRHKQFPQLTGCIVSHEYHSEGKFSALPYTVYWYDGRLAHDLLGSLPLWPPLENIEQVEAVKA